MFEVKVQVFTGAFRTQITIAQFQDFGSAIRARNAAVRFAKQVHPGYEVDVYNVADEDSAEKAFGLVYHHDAEF